MNRNLTTYKPSNSNACKGVLAYKFSFNGKEKTDIDQGVYDFGARLYNAEIGRWFSVDPLVLKYPFYSPYISVDNSPLYLADLDGKDGTVKVEGNTITISAEIIIWGRGANEKKAEDIQKGIMDVWGKPFTYTDPKTQKVYNVKFDVKVVHSVEDIEGGQNSIRVDDVSVLPGKTSSVWGDGKTGNWGTGEVGNVYAHEFGHLLGVDDQYKKIDKNAPPTDANTVNFPGVDKFDIMGKNPRNIKAHVTKSTIDALAKNALVKAPLQEIVVKPNTIDRAPTSPYKPKWVKGNRSKEYSFTLRAKGMPFRNRKKDK